MNFPRFLRTVAQLKKVQLTGRAAQAGYRLWNRVCPSRELTPEPEARCMFERPVTLPDLLGEVGQQRLLLWDRGEVSYHGVAGPADDWKAESQTRLWQYERHYQDEIQAMAVAVAKGNRSRLVDGSRFLTGFRRSCPFPGGTAWEPYPTARRILNQAIALAQAPDLSGDIVPWLPAQLRYLWGRLEHHLLGNHLIADAAALVAGAASVSAPGIAGIWQRGALLLERELDRQVLPDGGYAERTIQYHSIVLQDALVALALSQVRGLPLQIAPILERMLAFSHRVRRADGSFPLVNDATTGGTVTLETLDALARFCGVAVPPDRAAGSESQVDAPDTGWCFIRSGAHELFFDHGEIGPPEQPGHGHADTMGYELIWDNAMVVCDTGVSSYAIDATRAYERSPSAHAVCSVDGEGLDEPWAAFRVGGRAKIDPLEVLRNANGEYRISCSAQSYSGWRHAREILFLPGARLRVSDTISDLSKAGARITTFIPLAPSCVVVQRKNSFEISISDLRLTMDVEVGKVRSVDDGWISRGFGSREPRKVLAIDADSRGQVCYNISRNSVSP